MRILTEKINLDLNQNGIQATIDLREGDIESRLIIATLRGHGDAFRPDDNVIAVIRAKKPDGTIIFNNCVVEDGKVKFLITSQYAAVEGNYNACIEIVKNGEVLYTPKFAIHVSNNELSDSEVESSSEYTELTTALEQALTALELAQNLHLLKFVENLEDEGDEKYLYVLTSDYHYIPYVWDAENERYMQLESNLEELTEFSYLLSIQKERVDNLLAEAVPGSTTRDLEVIDGRNAYDGRTYANLGTAIREQVYNLHEENNLLEDRLIAADDNLDNIKANKSDVNTTVNSIENEISVERARIDNLVALPDGSTTADAELVDIRVGANGTTYASAGDAVREQVIGVKDVINMRAYGEIITTSFVQGVRSANNPTIITSNNARCTSSKIIQIKKGDYININGTFTGVKYALAGKFSDGTTLDSGWKTSEYNYTATNDIILFVNVAKTDGTSDIEPADFQITITAKDKTSKIANLNGVCNNLMGMDASVYYKVNAYAGQKITISTSDRSIFPSSSTLIIELRGTNGNRIDYFTLKNEQNYKTITMPSDIVYFNWNEKYSVPLMVNIGDSALPYEEYSENLNEFKEETKNKDDNIDFSINVLNNLIDFKYHTPIKIHERSIDVYKNNNFVTLNIPNALPTSNCIIRLNNSNISYPISKENSSMVESWENESISLKTGHKYKIYYKTVSGTKAGNITLSVYRAGESSSVGNYEYTEDGFIRTFIAEADTTYNFCVYISQLATANDFKIAIYLEDLTIEESDIEEYYITEINDTIAKIYKYNDEPALVFPWVTDIHKYSQTVQTFDKMIKNINEVSKNIKCDLLFNTGDSTDGNVEKSITTERNIEMLNGFNSLNIPYCFACGNHDTNVYKTNEKYTLKEVFSNYYSSIKEVIYNMSESGTEFYIDFINLPIRIISINSSNADINQTYAFGNNTASWLANIALNTNKTILLFVHVSPISSQVWNNNSPANSTDVNNAIQAFVNNGGNLIQFSGHSHVDLAFIDPYLSIMQVCQKFEKADISTQEYQAITGYIDVMNNPDRIAQTFSEDAWSIVIYKPFSNDLHLLRFGAGNDRHYHVTPIGETTVTSQLEGALTWSTSNSNIATVNNGVISGVSAGKCAIIAKDINNNYECWVVIIE